jgi:putative membrane protein
MKAIQIFSVPLLAFGLTALGCNSNKAATPDTTGQASSSSGTPANRNALSNSDQQFIANAAKGNRAEVELGQMIADKATNRGVKQFAQMMVKDHSDALSQLQQLAQSKSLTLPEGLPGDAQDLKQKLMSEKGTQLDKDYISGMVEDHQKDVKEFQDAAQNAQDPDVKQWASNLVPKLQEHLQKAQALDSTLNKAK